jgi:hypothetical protein
MFVLKQFANHGDKMEDLSPATRWKALPHTILASTRGFSAHHLILYRLLWRRARCIVASVKNDDWEKTMLGFWQATDFRMTLN